MLLLLLCLRWQLTGYVRGKPMSVNQLVHVTGVGAFHVAKIAKARGEPCPFKPAAASSQGASVTQQAAHAPRGMVG